MTVMAHHNIDFCFL